MQLADTIHSLFGALILDPEQIPVVVSLGLQSRHMPDPNTSALFEAIKALADAGEAIDLVMVSNRLERSTLDALGGYVGLCMMEQRCLSSAAAPDFAVEIIRASRLRSLAELAEKIRAACASGDGDPDAVIEATRRKLDEASQDGAEGEGEKLEAAVAAAVASVHRAKLQGCAGLSLGIQSLDRILGGLKPGSLTIIAARPSLGKTALALNVATNVATNAGIPVAMFSLEMGSEELGLRCACRFAKVDLAKVAAGFASQDELAALEEARVAFEGIPFSVHDKAFSLDRIVSLARRDALRGQVGLIMIDYLQLVAGPRAKGASRSEEVSTVSRTFKLLAKELSVPVVALSQLSRAVEERGAKPRSPQLSDLRDSGAIEQDADAVVFLHCTDPPEQRQPIGLLDVIVAKNRNGRCGKTSVTFHRSHQAITETARQ